MGRRSVELWQEKLPDVVSDHADMASGRFTLTGPVAGLLSRNFASQFSKTNRKMAGSALFISGATTVIDVAYQRPVFAAIHKV